VASSKPWHYEGFTKIAARKENEIWRYVSTLDELHSCLMQVLPRYIFFLHWSWFVPAVVLKANECVCFHMTDVPYGRGGSPLQNLILRGKTETIVTALRMTEELDAGPVYVKKPLALNGRAEEIYLRAGELCWEMIASIIETEPIPQPQTGKVTQFFRRKPEQSVLPETGSLQDIHNFIRMLDAPTYPPAFLDYGDFRLEFSRADRTKKEIHARVVIRQKKGLVDE